MSGSNKLIFSIPGHFPLFQIMFAYVFQKLQGDLLFARHFFFRKNSVLRNNIAKQIHGGREKMPDNLLPVGGRVFTFKDALQKLCVLPNPRKWFWLQTKMTHQLVPEIDKSIQPVDL